MSIEINSLTSLDDIQAAYDALSQEEETVVINGDSEEEAKSPTECEPSWSLGCLYRCAICSVKFQTLTSFQSHLFFHRTTPEQYLAQHGE